MGDGELLAEVQRHGTMLLASTVGVTALGFLATMFYAHWVGAGVLGAYFLFMSYYGILSVFGDSGIGSAGIKRISEGREPSAYFTASLVLRIWIYVAIVIGLLAFRDRLVDINEAGLFWVLIAVLGIGLINSHVSTAIGGSNRLGLAAASSFINNVVKIGIQVATVYLGYGVGGLVGGLVAGLVIQAAIEWYYVDFPFAAFEWRHVRSIFAYSTWSFLITSGNMVFEYVGVVIIGYWLTIADVGVYGVCWTFSSAAIFVTMALANTLFVKVSRWHAVGDDAVCAASLSRATTYSLIFALPIFVGGAILGGRLLYYLYSAEFAAGSLALTILIGARVAQSVQQLFFTYLMAMDKARKAFYVITGASAANLLLDLVLIPIYGLEGAATAALVTIGISGIFAYRQISREIPVRFEWPALRRVAVALATMTAVLLLLDRAPLLGGVAWPLLLVGVGAIVYFGVLLAIDPVLREEALRIARIRWVQ